MLPAPGAVRMGPSHSMLDFLITYNALLRGVDEENLSRLQTALVEHLFLVHRYGAYLGGQNDPVIFHHIVPGRAQAVPVQHAADGHAVAEADGRRSVPGFHHEIVVPVKILLLPAHGGILLPGLRNHNHHGMGQGMACHMEILQAVIKHGGITACIVYHREGPGELRIIRGPGLALPGIEPVDIAADGIDFPVMHNVAVRMGPGPAGEGIGAEAGMNHGHGGLEIQIRQVQIEMAHLVAGKHALVHNGFGRQAGNIEIRTHALGEGDDFLLRPPPDNVQLPLEIHGLCQVRISSDKHLQEMGPYALGLLADETFIDGHLPPAQHRLSLVLHDILKNPLLLLPEIMIAVSKNHAHPVLPLRRQAEPQHLALPLEKLMGNLGQYPGAVTAFLVRSLAAPVLQVLQNLQGIIHNAIGTLSLDIRHKTDTAGIMLIPRIIQPLGLR